MQKYQILFKQTGLSINYFLKNDAKYKVLNILSNHSPKHGVLPCKRRHIGGWKVTFGTAGGGVLRGCGKCVDKCGKRCG